MRPTLTCACSLLLVLALGAVSWGCKAQPTATPQARTPIAAGQLPTEVGAVSPLIFAHPEDATKLDPSDVTDSESLLVTWHLYDGLTRYKPGTTEVEPALAISWTTSADGLEWVYNLRREVRFHDGTDFNADAVVWNFNRWFDREHPQHFASWVFQYWADMFQGFKGDLDEAGQPLSVLASVEAVDPMTVKLTLNRPNAPLLQTLAMGNFAFASPKAVQAAGESYGTPDGNPIAVGTGAYKLESWTPKESIRIVRNPDYWAEPPASDEIVFRVIPDGSQRFLAIQKGEIDAMNQVNSEDVAKAQADPNLQVVLEPANNVGYLGFNMAHKPWNDLNCRLAVAHAIDKVGIVDSLYEGDAEPASQMMPPSMWGYNQLIEDYPYDMAKAKEYLDKCLAKEKMPEKVVFYVPPIQRMYFPKPKELGEAIQASLAELGLPVEIRSPDWKTVFIKDVDSGVPDLYLLGWQGDNGDPDNYLCMFFCGGSARFNSDAEGNPLPPDKVLNDLLRQAATVSDQSQRAAMYERANQMIHEILPAVPIVHRAVPLFFRQNVRGYVPSPIQTLLTGVKKE